MATRQKRNLQALKIYLDSIGLDSNRVAEEGLDEEGFDYIKLDYQGRALFDSHGQVTRLARERRAWPTKEAWSDIQLLLEGGGLADTVAFGDKEPAKPAKAKPAAEVKAD